MEEAINKQEDKLITYFVIIKFPKKLILGFLQSTAFCNINFIYIIACQFIVYFVQII